MGKAGREKLLAAQTALHTKLGQLQPVKTTNSANPGHQINCPGRNSGGCNQCNRAELYAQNQYDKK